MEEKIYLANTKPGQGTYRCTGCVYEITLLVDEELPICPICGVPTYTKIK